MTDEYPTRGISLIVPPNATLPFQGWSIRFARRGHNYDVGFHAAGLKIERDGENVKRWDDVPGTVRKLIVKTRDTYAAAFCLAAGLDLL